MEINLNNYESILIDYLDGNLSPLEVAEVLLFLEQHPQIKQEFEHVDTLPILENEEIDVAFKSSLKKLEAYPEFHNKNFDALMVMQLEGEMDNKAQQRFDEVINKSSSLLRLKKIFEYTKLQADYTIVFPDKQQLKQKGVTVISMYRYLSVAAAILLLVSLAFLIYKNNGDQKSTKVASITKKQTSPSLNTIAPNETITNQAVTENKLISGTVSASRTVANKSETPLNTVNLTQSAKVEEAPVATKIVFETLPSRSLIKSSTADISESLAINEKLAEVTAPSFVMNENNNEFLTIGNWVKKKLIDGGKEHLIEKEKPGPADQISLDPMTVASIGAGIVERTTGKKVSLSRSYNKKGNVSSYTFAAGNFKLERTK